MLVFLYNAIHIKENIENYYAKNKILATKYTYVVKLRGLNWMLWFSNLSMTWVWESWGPRFFLFKILKLKKKIQLISKNYFPNYLKKKKKHLIVTLHLLAVNLWLLFVFTLVLSVDNDFASGVLSTNRSEWGSLILKFYLEVSNI